MRWLPLGNEDGFWLYCGRKVVVDRAAMALRTRLAHAPPEGETGRG
jgi:hypothetical protein